MTPSQLNSDDLYGRLGVPRTASIEEIKRAYRALVRQYPPERAPEEFKRIREAYEAIGTSDSRATYDRGAGSEAEALIAKANAEMQQQQYAAAEHLLKRALLDDATLSYARNLLGLCYLYQKKADEAIVQYSRLLREPNATGVWYGNAAHAYRLAKRYADAEQAFATAIQRSPTDSAERYVAWAEMYLEQRKSAKARSLLEKAVKADGKEDFDDVPLLLALLDVDLFERRSSDMTKTLRRIRRACVEDAQKTFAGWRLALVAWQLILALRFRGAHLVATAANELKPLDTDYDALREVAESLAINALQRASRSVRSHIAFAKDGWLARLGPPVLQYCEEHVAYEGMRPIPAAPGVRTINGIGTAVYGHRDYDQRTSSYVATQYFCVLFVPVIPLACFRVKSAGSGWEFLGKVRFGKAQKAHLLAFVIVTGLWVMKSVSERGGSDATNAPVSHVSSEASPASLTGGVNLLATPPESASASGRPVQLYEGTVTNDALPTHPGTLQIAVDAVADTSTGRLDIGTPLGGSGKAWLVMKPDSLLMLSGNAAGDTIVWGGRRAGAGIRGRYFIARGADHGQRGSWIVRRTNAAP